MGNIFLKLIILSLFSLALFVKGYAYDNGDFQFWNTDIEEKQINDRTKLVMEEEFRWGDNASDFYYQSRIPDFTTEIQSFTFLPLDAIIFRNMEKNHV